MKKAPFLSEFCLGTILVLCACTQKPTPPSDPPPVNSFKRPEKGPLVEANEMAREDLYAKFCVSCHGADGKGLPDHPNSNLFEPPSRLQKSHSEMMDALREGMGRGQYAMPSFRATLTEHEISIVVDHVLEKFAGHN